MYTEKNLLNEIAEIVNGKADRQVAIGAEFVTLAVIKNHIPDFKRGSDFVSHCIWSTTRKSVGNYIARKKKDGLGEIQQATLPGFSHVQRRYVVNRNEEDVFVNTYLLSWDEITALANARYKTGKTEIAHGDELIQFRDRVYPNGKAQ